MQAVNNFLIRLDVMIRSFFDDEEGDTNFISILVILAIAVVLAGVFIVFKDKILGWVNNQMANGFFNH